MDATAFFAKHAPAKRRQDSEQTSTAVCKAPKVDKDRPSQQQGPTAPIATYSLLEKNTTWKPTALSFPLIASLLQTPTVLSYGYEVAESDLKRFPRELALMQDACKAKDQKIVNANKIARTSKKANKAQPKEEEVSFLRLQDGKYIFPRMMGTQLFGEAKQNTLWGGEDMDPAAVFVGKLQQESPPQVEAVEIMWKQMQNKGGALLEAPCGSGKTIMLLNLAFEKVRKKTLWVCVRSNLLEQTQERLRMVAPNARAHTIKGSKKLAQQVAKKDIVFCTVQMISKLETVIPEEVLAGFGLVIIDEAHTVQTPVFMNMFQRLKPRYWATATATARRSDALFDPLLWHTGGIAVSMKRVWRDIAMTWHCLKYVGLPGETPPMETVRHGPQAGYPDFNLFMRFITSHSERNKYIVQLIKHRLAEGKIMFVGSAWKEHIHVLREMLSRAGVKSGILVGDKSEGLDEKVVFCTYAKAGIGVDKADINHLIDVTPWSSSAVTMTEQWVGRIRPSAEKKNPSLDSLVDNGALGGSMKRKRKIYYDLLNCVYTVCHVDIGEGDTRHESNPREEATTTSAHGKRKREEEDEQDIEDGDVDSFICDDEEEEEMEDEMKEGHAADEMFIESEKESDTAWKKRRLEHWAQHQCQS